MYSGPVPRSSKQEGGELMFALSLWFSPTHRPVGVFEFEKFAGGSKAVLEAIVAATDKGATSIIGALSNHALANNPCLHCMYYNIHRKSLYALEFSLGQCTQVTLPGVMSLYT